MPNFPPLPPDFLSPWGTPMRDWMQAAEQSIEDAQATADGAITNDAQSRAELANSPEFRENRDAAAASALEASQSAATATVQASAANASKQSAQAAQAGALQSAESASASASGAAQAQASATNVLNEAIQFADGFDANVDQSLAEIQAAGAAAVGAIADDVAAADQSRQQAASSASAAATSASTATTQATAAQTARTGAETARTGAEAARDLALAGQFAGTQVTGSIDTILTPGRYWAFATNVSKANGWPVDNATAWLDVRRIGADTNAVIHEVMVMSGITTNGSRGRYVRRKNGSTFEAWNFMPSQRVDQTAGRAIYTWDDINGREQLIHGNTGIRDISTLLTNVDTNKSNRVLIRRENFMVWMNFSFYPTNLAGGVFLPPLAGFNPSPVSMVGALALEVTGVPSLIVTQNASGLLLYLGPSTNTAKVSGSIIFPTNDNWPTSLPGTVISGAPTG